MNDIILWRKGIEEIEHRYDDIIRDEARTLEREHSIGSSEDIKKELAEIEDTDRLLRIGIVGRV